MSNNQILDLTAIQSAQKELYPDGMLFSGLTDFPFLMLVPKDTEGGGKLISCPLSIDAGSGSADFATAQASQVQTEYDRFALIGHSYHQVCTISGDAIEGAKGGEQSVVDLVKDTVDTKTKALRANLSRNLWNDGTGYVGKLASIDGSGNCTLATPADVVNLRKGMKLQATDTRGGTATAAYGYVKSINRAAKTFVVAATLNGSGALPTLWSASNFPYLGIAGDLNAVSTGVQGFLPATAPSSGESFLGLDRSSDSYMYGMISDGSGKSLEESLIDVGADLQIVGGHTDYIFANPLDFAKLAKALGTKNFVEAKDPTGRFGVKAIEFALASGNALVVGDPHCPQGNAFAMQMDTWKLWSVGDAPKINIPPGGQEWYPLASGDGAELRLVGRLMAVGCKMPGYNGRIINWGS
jgi:hypothetical protein